MDQKRLDECISALNKKGVRLPCPRCGSSKFAVVGESLIPINNDPSVFQIGGPTIPAIIVACENCGYLTQHAQAPLGLLGGKQNV